MIASNTARYSSLEQYLSEKRSNEQHRQRLADKLFHTVRSGRPDEIQSVIRQCVDAGFDFQKTRYDYLLEYFDSFHHSINPPEIDIVRLIFSYQKRISNKAKLSFYQNVYYRRLLNDDALSDFSELLNQKAGH